MVANLIVGGHDTTASQIGCTLLTLLHHPEALTMLRTRTASASDVVNETIRYEPSIAFVPRTLAEAVEIGGLERPAGSMVFLSTASANRDEAQWPEPDEFQPARFASPDTARLLSFGAGPHYCLGAALARMTLEEVIGAFADAALSMTPQLPLHAVAWREVLGRSPATLLVVSASSDATLRV
jgi:cytochrome P450